MPAEDLKQYWREKRLGWIAAGRCPMCGGERAGDAVHCERHLRYARVYGATRRAKLTASGLCVQCGEPRAPGKTRCQAHAELHNRRNRGRNRWRCMDCRGQFTAPVTALCTECKGRNRGKGKPLNGKLCAQCAGKHYRRCVTVLRNPWRPKTPECECGRPNPGNNPMGCATCREIDRQWMAAEERELLVIDDHLEELNEAKRR